jgi:hypothetical protein
MLIELTDGGHFDNTGLYELFRRRLGIIFCIDAGADPTCSLSDLSNALERARLDFGIQIRFMKAFPAEDLVPHRRVPNPPTAVDVSTVTLKTLTFADRPFAVAIITYPATIEEPESTGCLIVVKPSLVAELPADVLTAAINRPGFPHSSTADQFFDESKFDAYRQLGYYLTKMSIDDLLARNILQHRSNGRIYCSAHE